MSIRTLRAALTFAVAIVLHPTPAFAQDSEPRPASEAERPADATLDRFGIIKGTQFQVSTGTEDDAFTLGIALPTGPSQRTRFALILSTPIHNADGAMPASLDALANGSKATLRWGRFGLGEVHPNDSAVQRIEAQAQRACLAAQTDPTDPKHLQFGGACQQTNRNVHNYALRDYRNYLAKILTSGVTDYGIEASVGVNDFEWIDPATFASQKQRRTSWSVAGHYTHYRVSTPTAFTFSAAYQRAYEASQERLLCPPNAVDPATQCKTARGAGPARKETLLFSAGLRHRFMAPDGTLLGLAVAPTVTYDALDKVFGVDVPVYLVPSKEDGLTGGLRFGYRSDRVDKFSISVFFGAAFSLWQK